MRIYRGPATNWDQHELVDIVDSNTVAERILRDESIPFNISKEGAERSSTCRIAFSQDDGLAVVGALLAKMNQSDIHVVLAYIIELLRSDYEGAEAKIGNAKELLLNWGNSDSIPTGNKLRDSVLDVLDDTDFIGHNERLNWKKPRQRVLLRSKKK